VPQKTRPAEIWHLARFETAFRIAFRVFLFYSVMPLIGRAAAVNTVSPAAEDRWYTLDIHVVGLPAGCRFVVVSQSIDFTAILAELHVTGAVDAHSIQLILVGPDRHQQLEPAQWTSDIQPRPKAPHLLPSTTRSVSYIAEHGADATPPVRVSGTLTWAIHAGEGSERHYLLKFRVPKDGRFVQAPYIPQDLHAFDSAARATSPSFPDMQIHPQWPVDGRVDLFQGPTRVLGYHIGPTTLPVPEGSIRRPFMYPVIGPDGIPLTEFGKPHDPTGSHAHHYSLWIAHANVDGHDFWSEKGGAIVHSRLEDEEDGPVFCRLVQSTRWMWEKSDLLHERRTITLYHTPDDFRLIDVDLEFTPSGKEPVTFGKSTFGFLATRVRQSMTVFDGGGEILNSHGDRNEQNVHLKHADWIDLSGPIAQDKWGGIAILDHPSNPNHPSMFHCRNDGWACASFSGEAPYLLDAGKTMHLRYRVVLHRGNATEGNIAQHFTDYATAPTLRLGPH
jgi:hypothetical protein